MSYLELARRHPRYLGFGFMHYFFSAPGQSFLIAIFVPYFLEHLKLEQDTFGWLYMIGTLGSALTLPLVGKWLDQWVLRHFSLGLGILFVIVCLATSQINSIWWLGLCIYGLRLCGQGSMPLTGSTAIARFFTETRGKALSLISFGISAAEILLPLSLVALIGLIGWQGSWLIIALGILAIYLPIAWFLIPADDPFQFPETELEADNPAVAGSFSRKDVLRDWRFYCLTLVYLFQPFFITGVFINQHLFSESDAYGWSPEALALGLSIFGFSRLIGNLLSGPLIDRLSARRVFSFMLFPMMITLIPLLFSGHVWAFWLFMSGCGLSGALSSISSTAAWAELYGTRHLGAIRSMVSTVMVFGSAIAPVITGYFFVNRASIILSWWGSLLVMGGLTVLGFWVIQKD